MALSRRRNTGGEGLHVWPGYVDALSTLLMVIIFVLLVFVLAQAFLSYTLSGKEHRLDELSKQLTLLSRQFALEKQKTAQLQGAVAEKEDALAKLADSIRSLTEEKRQADTALALHLQARQRAEAKLTEQTEAAQRADQARREAETKFTEQAKAAQQTQQALQAQTQARQALEAKVTEQDQAAQAKDADLNRLRDTLEAIRKQLAAVQSALDASDKDSQSKDRTIANLGMRLNIALAEKVEELKKYRSEFFGKLREVLAGQPGVQVAGDRFIFQSDVLFPSGSADLTEQGQQQIKAIAATLTDLSKKFPANVSWLLRVDGHADRHKVTNGKFPSNWELSAQRAINVARLLIEQGVPGEHVSADAFSDYQPVSAGTSDADMARDRRIELRLTDR